MTAFKDQAFGARWLVMGDIAEAAFRELYPNAVRTGLDRAATTRGLSLLERYEPDFAEVEPIREPYRGDPVDALKCRITKRIEVMGIGRDQKLKLKVEKAFALCGWDAVEKPDGGVDLFVWDSSKKRYCTGDIDLWIDALFQHGVYAYFPEGKAYIELHARYFPYKWYKP